MALKAKPYASRIKGKDPIVKHLVLEAYANVKLKGLTYYNSKKVYLLQPVCRTLHEDNNTRGELSLSDK